MWNSNHPVVVAIDFGTTFSGYAFSFKDKPKAVKTNTSWSKQLVSLKAPTSVLLDDERKFHSFGYEAEAKYGQLMEDEEGEEWSLFRKFKMVLYNNPELSQSTEVTDVAGKTKVPAIRIFSWAIRFLKDHALNTLNARDLFTDDDIFFVLTVPAIWDDMAKRLMREASVEAGIRGDHLGIALESEAASIWCHQVPMVLSSGEKYHEVIKVPGTKYIVIDLGGGTADITIHETLNDDNLKEVYKASGGDWGGTMVDKRFISMLTQVLGKETMIKFGTECISDFFDLLREFELTKRTISNESTNAISIKLPASLHEIHNENKKGKQLRSEFMKTMKASTYGDKVTIKGDKLRIDPELARDMFAYSAKGITDHLHELLDRPDLCDIKIILFVGGFSECSIIQDAVRASLPDKTVIFPPEGGLCVLKGAVLYGHRPGIIAVRRARFTYGVKTTVDFNPDIHPARSRKSFKGVKEPKCTDQFRVLVQAGEEITTGYTINDTGTPDSDSQLYVHYDMYISTDKNPVLVTDNTCKRLGRFEVKLPKGGQDRTFETSFVFGDVEMMLKVRHLSTGVSFTEYFNFL